MFCLYLWYQSPGLINPCSISCDWPESKFPGVSLWCYLGRSQEYMIPLVITLANSSQLFLCCKGADSFLCKMSWCKLHQIVLIKTLLMIICRLFCFLAHLHSTSSWTSSVKAALEMYILTSVESMSQLSILHSICADIKGISFLLASAHILLWQLFFLIRTEKWDSFILWLIFPSLSKLFPHTVPELWSWYFSAY